MRAVGQIAGGGRLRADDRKSGARLQRDELEMIPVRSDQPLVMLAGLGAEICRPAGFFAEFLVGVMRRQPFGSVVAETLVARTPGPSRQP
jgi:hypothetical protein